MLKEPSSAVVPKAIISSFIKDLSASRISTLASEIGLPELFVKSLPVKVRVVPFLAVFGGENSSRVAPEITVPSVMMHIIGLTRMGYVISPKKGFYTY